MINPYEHDESPVEADDRRLCGCKHPQCWLVEDDPTNVNVKGTWFAADCVGLCWTCGEIDSLANLVKLGGSYLCHEGCVMTEVTVESERERDRLADERRGK